MTELQRVKQVLAKHHIDNESLAIELAILAIETQKEAIEKLMSK